MKLSNIYKSRHNNLPALYQDWLSLCEHKILQSGPARNPGAEVVEKWWKTISDAYNEEHRHYHNLTHIAACLVMLDEYHMEHQEMLPFELENIKLAIWFHDVIYDTKAYDNEEKSAGLASEAVKELQFDFFRIDPIKKMILNTKHTSSQLIDHSTDVFLDIDLSILGEVPEIFDEYEMKIQKEYSWVPSAVFRTKRAGLLQVILNQPLIYRTEFFKLRFELQARYNLLRSISKLKAPL